ncbi:phage tail protein [Pseudoalteromonas phenolica]|uniref:tail protein X n=1 Tax=Pseudoalteromonas phenolica TaxID=161398 RepID=UPI00110A7BDD|nr:tail protein X [Pseudoalteromonas phenolica]TMN89452.1 phage tail protein [Pseudoalteromonas phenolica]
MAGVYYITRDGDCLDLICYKHYGVMSGAVEMVLDNNYGLAELGAIYPENIRIYLPDMPVKEVINEINIWD